MKSRAWLQTNPFMYQPRHWAENVAPPVGYARSRNKSKLRVRWSPQDIGLDQPIGIKKDTPKDYIIFLNIFFFPKNIDLIN